MVRVILRYGVIALLCISQTLALAQYFEGGVIMGASVYDGELSPHKFIDKTKYIRPAAGLFVRQNFNEFWSARLSFVYGKLEGADEEYRADRNLNFFTDFGEIAVLGEFSFPGFDPTGFKRLSPYGYVGLAYMYYNPKTVYQGRTIYLQPQGTEGQGLPGYDNPYSLNILSIPFGGGIKYALSPSITIAAEFGPRMTFTDYIDDVSGVYPSYTDLATTRGTTSANLSNRSHELTGAEPIDRAGERRGNPKFNDWYFVGNITISYHLYDLFNSRLGCPMDF